MNTIGRVLAIAALAAFCAPRPAVAQTGCTSSITFTSLVVDGAFKETVVGDSLTIGLTAKSACQVQSVTAQAFGSTVTLTYNGSQNRYTGTLSIADKPHVAFVLTGTVTDINGASGSMNRDLVHDTTPVMSLTQPRAYATARPSIRVTGNCTDDAAGGCASFVLSATRSSSNTSAVLLSATSSIDADVSLAAYEGEQVTLTLTATDTVGQSHSQSRIVLIESNPRLVLTTTADGPIVSESVDYLLSLTGSFDSGLPQLRDKRSGQTTQLSDTPGSLTVGYATNEGAILTLGGRVIESRQGIVSDLGFGTGLRVAGNYAVFGTVRRSLDSGTNVAITGPYGVFSPDVADNGDVVFFGGGDRHIYRMRDGNTAKLTDSHYNWYPVTDGIGVAYYQQRTSGSAPGTPPYSSRRIGPDSTNIVLSENPFGPEPKARTDYAVTGGWSAFTRPMNDSLNVWVRSPAGVENQATFFGDATVTIAALNNDGRVVVRHGGRFLLAAAGAQMADVSLSLAFSGAAPTRAFWRDGFVHVILGSSVFKLDGPEVVPGCTSNIAITSLAVDGAFNGTVVGDSLTIGLTATSVCEVQSVSAQAFGSTVPLTYNGSQSRYTGTLSIAGRPNGPFVLTGTATDINGTSGSMNRNLVHDTPPAMAMTQPRAYATARPAIRVTGSCTDDAASGCASFVLSATRTNGSSAVLLNATNSVDADVSLAAYEGQEITLTLTATDTVGQSVNQSRIVFVESNPRLVLTAVADGPVLGDSADYLLYATGAFTNGAFSNSLLLLRDKRTGQTTQMVDAPGTIRRGYVTNQGAIAVWNSSLVESRQGIVSSLSSVTSSPNPLRVAGNYAIFQTNSGTVVRRALDSGTDIEITGPTGIYSADVADNGDVVFFGGGDRHIYRARDGNTAKLTSSHFNWYPVTDGIGIAYYQQRNGSSDPATPTYSSRRIGPDATNIALSENPFGPEPRPRRDYAVTAGWSAFTRPVNDSLNVWVRSPAGVETQVTFFGDSSISIAALNNDGRVVVRHGGRFLLAEPGALTDVSFSSDAYLGDASTNVVFWRDGFVHLILGSSVFKLQHGTFIDPVLTEGVTVIRAVHISELRDRIDAARSRRSLAPFAWSAAAPVAGGLIRARDILDLRAALVALYTVTGQTPPVYTDADLSNPTFVKAVHIRQLRSALLAVE